jgi:hypothetical protein
MPDPRDLLQLLKFELEFLEKGGYGRSPRAPWRRTRIFEDSPTCPNHALPEKVHPCSECALMELVPEEARARTVPCDHIPLNEAGETIETFYHYATQEELEEALRSWLRRTIQSIEAERAKKAEHPGSSDASPLLAADETARDLTGLRKMSHLFKKCANPLCITPFDPASGGAYFRFELGPEECCSDLAACRGAGTRRVKHFWLCAHCRVVFRLVNQPEVGVMLQLLWPELPEKSEPPKLLPA